MSDLTTVPKAHVANTSAIADFAEIECLKKQSGNVSSLDVARSLQREDDECGEERVTQSVAEAFNELSARVKHCGTAGRYPYDVRRKGNLLTRRQSGNLEERQTNLVYWYLLLSTRMDMKRNRNHGGEDGTAIFEHLCREVAIRFWGGPNDPRVDAIVFGTGRRTENLQDDDELDHGVFKRAVGNLCDSLREGLGFRAFPNCQVHAKDGKLDVVVWRGFSDKRAGQLIGFAQCKTGTHWRNDLTKLRPDGFCTKWLQKPPVVPPIRLYFVAERVVDQWHERCVDGGILFDRCRIMDNATDLPPELMQRIETWVRAAAASEGLVLP